MDEVRHQYSNIKKAFVDGYNEGSLNVERGLDVSAENAWLDYIEEYAESVEGENE